MKIVRIDGGLGNQMFCYAFALALAQASGEEVLLDTHRYKFFKIHSGCELNRLFDLRLKEATRKQLWKVTYPADSVLVSRIFQRFPRRKSEIVEDFNRCYPEIISSHKDGYYIGNWQWYKYFDAIKEDVVKAFAIQIPLDNRNSELYNRLLHETDAVSLHIRRGDYLDTPQYCGICDEDYYNRAIRKAKDLLQGHGHFLIFSNDIPWCKAHIVPLLDGDEVTVVDWNVGSDSYKDLCLMKACRVNIIANSSFSWWAAYLNQRGDKVVFAPDKWINLPLDYRIQCDDWFCL